MHKANAHDWTRPKVKKSQRICMVNGTGQERGEYLRVLACSRALLSACVPRTEMDCAHISSLRTNLLWVVAVAGEIKERQRDEQAAWMGKRKAGVSHVCLLLTCCITTIACLQAQHPRAHAFNCVHLPCPADAAEEGGVVVSHSEQVDCVKHAHQRGPERLQARTCVTPSLHRF